MSADNPVTLSSDIESMEGGDARSSDDALDGLTQVVLILNTCTVGRQ